MQMGANVCAEGNNQPKVVDAEYVSEIKHVASPHVPCVAKEEPAGDNTNTCQDELVDAEYVSQIKHVASPHVPCVAKEEPAGDSTNTYQDELVVVIGTEEDERVWALANRRLQERGRLLVFLTGRPAERKYDDNGEFQWWPPPPAKLVGEKARQFARKFGAKNSRRWIHKGPDIVELKDGEEYQTEVHGRGLRVMSGDEVVWEVSAKVVNADQVTDAAAVNLSVGTNGVSTVTPVPATTSSFISLFISFALATAMFLCNDYEKEGGPPWARGFWFGVVAGLYTMGVGNVYLGSAVTGIENTSTNAKIVHFLVGMAGYFFWLTIPIGSNTLTIFVGCVFATIVPGYLIIMPLHAYAVAQPTFSLKPGEKAPERVRILGLNFARLRYFSWAKALGDAGFGTWILFYVIGVVYVMGVGAGYGAVSNAILPIATTALEGLSVALVQMAYVKHVHNIRASGNQMFQLSISTCHIHGFAEGVKLYSMISSAAYCEDNPNGLKWPGEGSCDPYGWVSSVIVGIAVNLAARSGWSRYLLCRFLRAVRLTTIATRLAPSVATKLHDESKYCFGYMRFVIGGAVITANLLTGKEAILFNKPATICFIAVLIIEVFEDFILGREFLPNPPSPNPRNFMMYDNCDPSQLYAFTTSTEAELERRKSMDRKIYAPALLRTDGDYFTRALPLHGTRSMTFFELFPNCLPCVFFSLCLCELLVGAGYFHGVCDLPLPEGDRFKEAALWPNPLDVCRYSN